MVVSLIGGGNRSTQRNPPTCRKLLTNFTTKCCIEYTSPWTGFELTTLVVIGTDCIGSCKSNYHTITATTAPIDRCRFLQQHMCKNTCIVRYSVILQHMRKTTVWCFVEKKNTNVSNHSWALGDEKPPLLLIWCCRMLNGWIYWL